ncbi:MAG: elongation factor G [Pseudomonadota bacterium]|nr:elongation factor G [Pseudomonadota bacterium]
MPKDPQETAVGTRVIALVGPAGAGKTDLAEALLFASGAIQRQGSTGHSNSVGDSSAEARARGGSTELNLMHFDFLGGAFALIDAPGSIGFAADAQRAIAIADLAIVVVDPDAARAALAAPALRMLDEQGIPHLIFVNRIDQAHGSIRDLLVALQPLSTAPLIARQIPIRAKDGSGDKISGFVDLALERAYHYSPGKPSEIVPIPADLAEREVSERTHLLEQLADHDDALLENLLMDETPAPAAIFADLARETSDNLGVSVLFGSATHGWGIRRLLKALRHEAPRPAATCYRLGVEATSFYAFKVSHGGTVGRLVLGRILGGGIEEGSELRGANRQPTRLGTLFSVQGDKTVKLASAPDGTVLAVAKVDGLMSGQWLSRSDLPPSIEIEQAARNACLAIEPADRKDDVKLSGALARVIEEDPSLVLEQDEMSHELRLKGINDEHLRGTLARIKRRYGVDVTCHAPSIGYRESVRRAVTQRGKHKKQSGGHGQFGDVLIEIAPLARGEGFRFTERISGGAVPRQYIPAVEQGVRDAMAKGPMGYPVVDVAVTLIDGSYHSVDSSELAFRTAGRIAMQEALAQAAPHLLEPVQRVTVTCPSSASSRATSATAGRRGQMLGMGPREGWTGWDQIEALIPEVELDGFEAELRSLSHGLASYEAKFDHLAEVSTGQVGKLVRAREAELA